MRIELENAGRKFNRDWILRGVDLILEAGNVYVVTGPNGSGKSTFLQLLAGNLPLTEGKIVCFESAKPLPADDVFRYVSVAAPYLEMIEEFTLQEAVAFHCKFKPLRNQLTANDFIEKIGLAAARHKLVGNFSSGMKTRLKLGLACHSDTPVLLLDEPTSNLDAAGIAWYRQLLSETIKDRLVVLCSNQAYEYETFMNILRLQNGRLIRDSD